MSATSHLSLTLVETSQAQKEVTVNAALCRLDAVLNTGAKDKDLATPPGSPAAGDVYIVASSPTGAWTGHAKHIAYFDQAWKFIIPNEGMTLWVNDENLQYTYDGSAWVTTATFQNLAMLGVNATADATNKLAVASSAVLFNNVGNGVQMKLNKNAAGDTASTLYQTATSGRAEVGLCGDDHFHFKVSPDGSAWTDALVINKTTGSLTAGGTAPSAGDSSTSVPTTAFLQGAVAPLGQCRLVYTSSTVCTLQPFNGNRVIFPNGAVCVIGSSGITTTVTSCHLNGTGSSSLSASTLYYAYLASVSGSYVIDWSATAYATDSTTGIKIKSGDAARVLVGMAYIDSGPAFADSANKRFVRSWFNDPGVTMTNAFTADRSTTSTSAAEVNSEIRCQAALWSGERVSVALSGYAYNDTAGTNSRIGIGIDSTSTMQKGFALFTEVANSYSTIFACSTATQSLSEGFHYFTILAYVTSNTLTFWRDDSINILTSR